MVTTFAGNGEAGFSDGTGSAARFNNPAGVALDSSGNLYVADEANHRIRKITPAGVVTTLAGDGYRGLTNGPGSSARFDFPSSVALDSSGNVYVADSLNNRIRKVSPAGVVTTLAGSGNGALVDGAGTTQARFWYPNGVAVSASGNVYVGDTWNNRLRLVSPSGWVTTLAGSGLIGDYGDRDFADGPGNLAKFWRPIGVAVHSSGTVYIADKMNHRIRKYTSAGMVSTLAGSGDPGFTDGTGSAAQFGRPEAVAVDAAGNVYVAEFRKIRKVTPAGVVTTLAGGDEIGFRDGVGTNALFNEPAGIAVDAAGNLYIGDYLNHRIRKLSFAVPGSWSWTSPSHIPNAGTNPMSVTFTPDDNVNFSPVTTQVNVIVSKAVPAILSSPTATSIQYGQALASSTLSGGSANVAGSFAWAVPSTIPGAGTSSHSVIFTPNDTANLQSATTTANLTVNKATPTLSAAPTASAIFHGQTLASSTLSGGSASVPGTFAWTTPSAVPGLGTTSHSVIFTPTDTANYHTRTTTVSVLANQVPLAITSDLSAVTLNLGASYSYQITASGSPTSFGAVGMPTGLRLNGKTGLVSGIATKTGAFSVTLQAQRTGATPATATKVITVVQAPGFTYPATNNASRGKSVNLRPKITGFPAPTFSLTAGSLPPGLSLNASTAAITGIPTAAGSYAFTVRGTNSAGQTSRSTTILVK